MTAPRAFLILNGKQAGNDDVRALVHERRKAGWDLAVRLTWEPGDAERLVREAQHEDYPVVIAGGGDGTVSEVANALQRSGCDASLAVLPLGTANDFAHSAGLPLELGKAIALVERPPVAVDLGDAQGQLFVNMATGGFGTKITVQTPEELKRTLGGGAYLLTGLTRFSEMTSAFGRFRGPDFEWEGYFLVLGIGNGRQAGGGHLLCPRARIDDGLLDLCILPEPKDAVETLATLVNGGIRGLEAVTLSARLPWVEVETPDDLHLNLDGEPLTTRKLRIEVRPGALRMHLPANSPLLAG